MDLSDSGKLGVQQAEKRSSPRIRVRWRLLILLPNGDKKAGYALDISEGGMCLSSIHAFPVGSQIRVGLFVPDAQKYGNYLPTQLDCRVAYQVLKGGEVHLGLEFIKPSEDALSRIRAAISMKQRLL